MAHTLHVLTTTLCITFLISTSSDSAINVEKYDNATRNIDSGGMLSMASVHSGKSKILNQKRKISFSQTTVSDKTQNHLNDEAHEDQSGNNDNENDYSESKYFDSTLCHKTWNCDHTTSWLDPPYLCFCDDMCTLYKDCCQNAKVRSDQDFIVVNASFDCLYIPSINDDWFVYIVNTCPENTNYELHRLCIEPIERNIYSKTPVTSFTNHFLYRNMYCAICNGETDYMFWKVLLRCVWKAKDNSKFISLSIQELYTREECYMLYKEPIANSYRKCYPKITQCSEPINMSTTRNYQNGNDATLCEDGDNRYVFTSDVIYKNPACYECNKETYTNQTKASCNFRSFKKQHINIIYPRIYNLNAIMDLPSQQLIVTRYHRETSVEKESFVGLCGPNEAYDPFNGGCRNLCYENISNCLQSFIRTSDTALEYTSYDFQYVADYNEYYWTYDFEYHYAYQYEQNDSDYEFDYTNFTSEECQEKWKCDSSVTRSKPQHYCYCDKLCSIYKDCCQNAIVSFEDNANDVVFDCIYIPRIYDRWFVFVVNSCPKGTDYELLRLCGELDEQNVYRSTPASALDTGILYRNMYCAMCNGVEDYVFWTVRLQCGWTHTENPTLGSASIDELYLQDKCSFFYEAPRAEITYRQCYPKQSSCPDRSNEPMTSESEYDTELKCKNGSIQYVFTSDAIFKNPSCYECNKRLNTTGSNASCTRKSMKNLNLTDVARYDGPYTLSMLFDLSKQQSFVTKGRDRLVKVETFAGQCEDGEAYDPLHGGCKTFCGTYHNCTVTLRSVDDDDLASRCSYLKLNLSDFEIINNTIIRSLVSGSIYQKFQRLDDSVIICVNNKFPIGKSKTLIQVDDIFHISTNSISMLSLLATIFIYLKTSFHKLPGKCLLCLSMSLLIAQSMLLVAPVAEDSGTWCKVASLVMHYSFMTSFTWMNVLAYDVYYSFTNQFRQASGRGMKWFLKYSLYAWLSPLTILASAIFIDEFSVWKYRPKYADPVCWINNSSGLMVFFLSPIALILITNLLFFSLSFKNICMSYRSKTDDVKGRKPGQIFVYLKLSTVMGLTWVFGFLGNAVNDDIFWTLFTISNALQGLFIFLGFGVNPLIKMLQSKRN